MKINLRELIKRLDDRRLTLLSIAVAKEIERRDHEKHRSLDETISGIEVAELVEKESGQ